MDDISSLTVIEIDISSMPGCYVIVSLELSKKESVSSKIEDIVTQEKGNLSNIAKNLEEFIAFLNNESVAAFLFDNGKLFYCSLPPDKGMQDLIIARNFGGIFRDEKEIIVGRTSKQMFPSLIATIPREIANNNCVFIPTPVGVQQQDGSVSFVKNDLKKQFGTIMDHVKKSSEKILLAPLWYAPTASTGHVLHNVFLSVDVYKSKKHKHIVGHCIDTLDNLSNELVLDNTFMKTNKLNESDIKGIKFIDTYNSQGFEGKTCTNFTEANLFLAANVIFANPDIDYNAFSDIINSKTFQILSAKTVLDRINPMQIVITFDPNKTIGRRYEFLPRRIVTIEPESIKEELLDSNTLCAICEFENLEVYEVPISFNADDGLRPTALLPLIKTLPIDQVKKLKDLFFKKIYDEYRKTIHDNDKIIFEKKFGTSFDNFENLYLNNIKHDRKNDEEIRSNFESLVKQVNIFEVESRSFLPPRLSKLKEYNFELFNKLIQIVDYEIEVYSIINDFREKGCFDLNNVKNIENIPRSILCAMNSKKLDNKEKEKFVQNILVSFNKDGNGILRKKELLGLLSTKPKFVELLYTRLDIIKENNKKEGKPYRTIELFSEELKHDIAMAFWHPKL